MDKKQIMETLKQADEVKPIAEFNGIKICTFEDCVLLTHADAITGDDELGLAERVMNENGLPARSRTKYAAVNPAKMFANRARYIENEDGKKVMQIVIDYRAISEQATGKVYLKNIPVYEIARNKDKQLVVEKLTTVEDTVFLSDFKEILNMDSMIEVLTVIDAHGEDKTAGEIQI